ncbi:MAG: stage II sporulation protein M [Kiritimatiellae bacterium]|nr:stage II sporulation protein M [Kiritimatiellia bacterium]
MIVDLREFAEREQPYWDELDALLERLSEQPEALDLNGATRLHDLYERACAGLLAVSESLAGSDVHHNLEALVGRAYGEIHAGRRARLRFAPVAWFARTFPRVFRRHVRLFALAAAITLGGALMGGVAVLVDPAAKPVVMPFAHLLGSPSERVQQEEAGSLKRRGGRQTFSAVLMANNVNVARNSLALGITFGLGTAIVLFHNGAILGAVCADYVAAGHSVFLAGWLLPHGAIEIPAILIAAQAGLLLGMTLLGRRQRQPLTARLRAIAADLATLIGGSALLLVWAALVESFLSQYHAPILYGPKIAFGCMQLVLLALLLGRGGAGRAEGRT